MNRRHLVHFLKHPSIWTHAIWRKVYETRHPDHPWLDPGAIKLIDSVLTTESNVLEWGAGRSTTWLAHRVGRLTSIEHDAAWYRQVRKTLADRDLTNVDLRFIQLPDTTEIDDGYYWSESPYAMVGQEFADEELDLVLVDGAMRQNCVARVLSKIKPGGHLVIDNARQLSRLDDWGIPGDWPLVHIDGRRLRDTAVWQRPSESRDS